MSALLFIIVLLSASSALAQGCWELEVKTCEDIFGEALYCSEAGRCELDSENSTPLFPVYKCYKPDGSIVESARKVFDHSVWLKAPAPPGQFGWSNWIMPNYVICAQDLKCECRFFDPDNPPKYCSTEVDWDYNAIVLTTIYVYNHQPVGPQNCIGAGAGGGVV